MCDFNAVNMVWAPDPIPARFGPRSSPGDRFSCSFAQFLGPPCNYIEDELVAGACACCHACIGGQRLQLHRCLCTAASRWHFIMFWPRVFCGHVDMRISPVPRFRCSSAFCWVCFFVGWSCNVLSVHSICGTLDAWSLVTMYM